MFKTLSILIVLFLSSFHFGGQNDSKKIVQGFVLVEPVRADEEKSDKLADSQTLQDEPMGLTDKSTLSQNNLLSGDISYHQEAVQEPDKHTDIGEVVEKVSILESNAGKASQGHHMTCKGQGLTNIYGYGALAGMCFKDIQTAYNTVYKWFEKELTTKDLATSLCFYNLGKKISDCQYYRDFMSL